MTNRRDLFQWLAAGAALSLTRAGRAEEPQTPLFRISLAQWSLNRHLFGGELDSLDFPVFAKTAFGLDAVEYVNQFFMDKGQDRRYLAELKTRCDDHGVRSLLIMCDREGDLGDPDRARRARAVENHYKWVEAAQYLGCHSIRVNARSEGSYEAQRDFAIDGLRRLCDFAADFGLDVIVENHGGLSSDGRWLASVIAGTERGNCGTLPDFGNFFVTREQEYDRYRGVGELMPFARGVSAKTYGFDAAGNETRIDYERMMRIVLDAGYRGYVGIEWEGSEPGEVDGIRLTKALLERLRDSLGDRYDA